MRQILRKVAVVGALALAVALASCAGDGNGDTVYGIRRNSNGPPEFEAPPHPRANGGGAAADNASDAAGNNAAGNGEGAPDVNAPEVVNRPTRRERPIPTVHTEAWDALSLYAPLTELREPTLANPVEVARRFVEAFHLRDEATLRAVLHPQSPFPLPPGDPAARPTTPEQRDILSTWDEFWTWHATWIDAAFGVRRWGDAQIVGRQSAAIAMVVDGAPDDVLVTVLTLGYWERVLDGGGASALDSANNGTPLPGGELQTRVGRWGVWGYRQEPRTEADQFVTRPVITLTPAVDSTFPGRLVDVPTVDGPDETIDDALAVLLELNRQSQPLDLRILGDDADGVRAGDAAWPPQVSPPDGWSRALARRVRQGFDEAPEVASVQVLRTVLHADGASMTRYARVELMTRDGYPRVVDVAFRSLFARGSDAGEDAEVEGAVVAAPWMLVDWVRRPLPTLRGDGDGDGNGDRDGGDADGDGARGDRSDAGNAAASANGADALNDSADNNGGDR